MFNNKNKLPAQPNRIRWSLTGAAAHSVWCGFISRKPREAAADLGLIFKHTVPFPPPRAALPHASRLISLKALTPSFQDLFGKGKLSSNTISWRLKAWRGATFFFLNKEDKRSMSDYVISESWWAVTNRSTLLGSVDVTRGSSHHTLWAGGSGW